MIKKKIFAPVIALNNLLSFIANSKVSVCPIILHEMMIRSSNLRVKQAFTIEINHFRSTLNSVYEVSFNPSWSAEFRESQINLVNS